MISCISAIGIANPANKFKQGRIYQFMADASGLDVNNRARLKSIYDNSGILSRYSVIPDFGIDANEDYEFFSPSATLEPFVDTARRMALYQREAAGIAEQAVRKCLSDYPEGMLQQITHLITVSCTGMYAPGLDIDLVQKLGLKTTTERTCINFMGCYGAINALKTADYICRANADAKVLVVSVELCTLHFQKENSLDNWVANSLFSDGAAAVLVENQDNRLAPGKPHLTLSHFYSEFLPQAQNEMGWYVGNTGFEMKLTSKVSKQIKNNIAAITGRLMQSAGLNSLSQIDAYAIHPGGRKILEAVEEALELPEESNAFAYEVLQQYGNMSSATILFVLQKLLHHTVKSNQQVLSFAFGPGLTVEGMVLKSTPGMTDVLIIGGGLAGLCNAIQLNRAGLKVTVIEKKTYPFHRVCGEYISNEVLPFFEGLGIDIDSLNPSRITRLEITSAGGKRFATPLDLGGFGVSRHTLDNYLYQKAQAAGVKFMLNTRVEDVRFVQDHFEVVIPGQTLIAPLVIGSYGKRSNLDQKLKRDFFYKRSPYLAVKFHIKADLPEDLIQLNNYKDGYCGVSKVDGDRWCMCYLAHRDDLRKYGTLAALEENVICKNPHLKKIFDTAEFLLDKPEVINEISFEKKAPVENHLLMSGDTAGMIAPLCGNGMAMAIHSSKLLSAAIIKNYDAEKFTAEHRAKLEQEYTRAWEKEFANRLWAGRQMQRLFGRDSMTGLTISMLNHIPPLANFLIKTSHGQPFS